MPVLRAVGFERAARQRGHVENGEHARHIAERGGSADTVDRFMKSAAAQAGHTDANGDYPLVTVMVLEDGRAQMMAISAGKALFSGIKGTGEEIPDLGDRSVRLANMGLNVLKGDTLIRILPGPVPDANRKCTCGATCCPGCRRRSALAGCKILRLNACRILETKWPSVTGAASGIGKALAQRFAAEGMRLVLADIEPAPLFPICGRVRAAGTQVIYERVDVSKPDDLDSLAVRVYEEFGAVNLLCNNAGILPPARPYGRSRSVAGIGR